LDKALKIFDDEPNQLEMQHQQNDVLATVKRFFGVQ
jgi:hypothetical protein